MMGNTISAIAVVSARTRVMAGGRSIKGLDGSDSRQPLLRHGMIALLYRLSSAGWHRVAQEHFRRSDILAQAHF